MPRKKTDKAIVREIREVMTFVGTRVDMPWRSSGHGRFSEGLAYEVIRSLIDGTENNESECYRKAKAKRTATAIPAGP